MAAYSMVGVPMTDIDTWNAMVDRLHAIEPTRDWVPITPAARTVIAQRVAQLRAILNEGCDPNARRTAE